MYFFLYFNLYYVQLAQAFVFTGSNLFFRYSMASSENPDISAVAVDNSASGSVLLSDQQRSRIERNRQKAILLRQARLTSRPYPSSKSRYVQKHSLFVFVDVNLNLFS